MSVLPPPPPRDALEGKGPQRRPQRRSGRRLEEVAKAVGGGYCRLQMHRLGALCAVWVGASWDGSPMLPLIAATVRTRCTRGVRALQQLPLCVVGLVVSMSLCACARSSPCGARQSASKAGAVPNLTSGATCVCDLQVALSYPYLARTPADTCQNFL